MTTIQNNIELIRKSIPEHVKLIAVSKTKPVEDIKDAIEVNQFVFGENKVQELMTKAQQLDKKLEWHMIGHLQTNKVKQLLPYVHLIHSVDSLKLVQEINKEAVKLGKVIHCLLQVHIAKEETKFGFSDDEVLELLNKSEFYELKNIRVSGFMGMATYTENENIVRSEFSSLKRLFDKVKKEYYFNDKDFKEISMGMSNDFKIAIEEGSTMVRVGSLIFGERNYHNLS